jgi:uncharacterized protein
MSGVHASQAGARVTLLRGADLVATPWKNGGGVTREIAAQAAGAGAGFDTFAWRVSVADVAQAGPFSCFEGVDRTLVLLEGAGMLLDASGPAAHTLALRQPLDVARFAGETPIEARLVDGPTRDFNLMLRRGVAHGTLEVWGAPKAQRFTAQTVLLYCARGQVQARVDGAAPVTLLASDTLRIDTSQADATQPVEIETQGEGAVLVIALDPAHETALPNDTSPSKSLS